MGEIPRSDDPHEAKLLLLRRCVILMLSITALSALPAINKMQQFDPSKSVVCLQLFLSGISERMMHLGESLFCLASAVTLHGY